MGTLGNTTTGFSYSVSGSYGDIAGGPYTIPAPGILVNGINVYYGNNGASENGRLYIWIDSGGHAGAWLIRGHPLLVPLNGLGWQYQGGPWDVNAAQGVSGDLYLPQGFTIWIGGYAASGILNAQGASSGTTDLGNTSDGDFSYHSVAGGGMGVLAAYITYNPLPAPTISAVTPNVAPAGSVVTISGTGLAHIDQPSPAFGVTIGGIAAAYTINSDTSVTATVPSGVSGVVTVAVGNQAGSASTTMVAGRIYQPGSANPIKGVYQPGSGVKVVAVYGPGSPPVRLW